MRTISDGELAPCPFCGEKPALSRGSVITCENAKCWGPSIWHMANPEDSAAAWNRRNPPSGEAGEGVWAEITEANHPVAETVLVARFDEEYGEWVLSVENAPVATPTWTHFLRPGRPLPTIKEPPDGE